MVPGYAFTQQNGWLLIILPWCEIIHGSLAKTRRQEVLHCNHFLIILFALGAACQVKDGELPRLTPLAPKIEHLFPLCMTGAKHRDRFGPVQVLSYFFKIACFFLKIAAPELPELSSELCSDSLSVSESLSSPEFDRRLKDPEETQQKLARLQLWSLAAKKPKPPIRFRPLLKANLTRPARVLSYGKDIKVQYDIGRSPTGSVWYLIQIVRWINCAKVCKDKQRQDQDIKYWIVRFPTFCWWKRLQKHHQPDCHPVLIQVHLKSHLLSLLWVFFIYFSNVQRISKVCSLRLSLCNAYAQAANEFFFNALNRQS